MNHLLLGFSVIPLSYFLFLYLYSFKISSGFLYNRILIQLKLIALSVTILIGYVAYTNLINIVLPDLLNLIELALPPLSYLSLKETAQPKGFSKNDVLHYIILFFYVLDIILSILTHNYYLNPIKVSSKVSTITNITRDGYLFTVSFKIIVKYVYYSYYTFMLLRFSKRISQQKLRNVCITAGCLIGAKILINFLDYFLPAYPIVVLYLLFPPVIAAAIFYQIFYLTNNDEINKRKEDKETDNKIIIPAETQEMALVSSAPLAAIALNKTVLEEEPREIDAVAKPITIVATKEVNVDFKDIETKNAIMHYFTIVNAHTKPGYTITDLSKGVKIPIHQISKWLNQYEQKNFNEFLNELRINELFKLIQADNALLQKYNLRALANMVGFKNRTTFISAFKKVTGKTPRIYFEELYELNFLGESES